jgi:hypothetical protein
MHGQMRTMKRPGEDPGSALAPISIALRKTALICGARCGRDTVLDSNLDFGSLPQRVTTFAPRRALRDKKRTASYFEALNF